MSQIAGIYDALAAMKVGSAELTATDITDVKLIPILDKDLPKRLLMPLTEGDMEYAMIGNLQTVIWGIQDLCLFAPSTSNFGIHQYSGEMLTYIGDYLTAVKAIKSPVAGCVITGVSFRMVPVLWGEKTYWSVDTTLAVKEIL